MYIIILNHMHIRELCIIIKIYKLEKLLDIVYCDSFFCNMHFIVILLSYYLVSIIDQFFYVNTHRWNEKSKKLHNTIFSFHSSEWNTRRELTFHLIGKFSVSGRAIFLLTRRRVFHFARLRNQVKNSSNALVGAYVSFVSICPAADFSACARVRVFFRTENEPMRR